VYNYLNDVLVSPGEGIHVSKVIWLNRVEWSVERPQGYIYFDEIINNTFYNGTLYMALLIHVVDFCPSAERGYRDRLSLNIIANVSINEGAVLFITLWYVRSTDSGMLILVPSHKGGENSRMTIRKLFEKTCLHNLRLVDHRGYKNATHFTAYFKCAPKEQEQANEYGITNLIDWILPGDDENQLSIILELVWMSSQASRKIYTIYMPALVRVSRDAGDDAESAIDLSNRVNITHSELHVRAYLSDLYDVEDNYRVYVEDGYRIVVRIAINKTKIDATIDDLALRLYIINNYGEETLANGEIVTIGGKQYLQAYYDVSGGYYVYIEVSVPDDPDDPDFEGLYDMFICITASSQV